jgi:DNA-binding transcriptional MerR regulator
MQQTEYSIDDLSRITGFTRRTIRNYIQQGLIDPPDTVGRNARYGHRHLIVLQAVRTLRENHGMALPDIRSALLFAEPGIVEELAAEAGTPTAMEPATSEEQHGSALEYIQSLKNVHEPVSERSERYRAALSDAAMHAAPESAPPNRSSRQKRRKSGSPLERLLRNIERLSGRKSVTPKSKGEQWVRIPVTPDIEISVRGANSPEQIARVEAIADRMRALLMEEDEHDNDN